MSVLPEAPPYAGGTLADVVPAAARLLDRQSTVAELLPGEVHERAPLLLVDDGDVESVTILLVDGWGWSSWMRVIDETPALASLSRRAISTTFPSTTPTALAAFGTALTPGEHGLVGAAFLLPEDAEILRPLSWERTPHPLAVQPEPTAFEQLERQGIDVALVGPSAYARSGLTRAGLRGGVYVGADTREQLLEGVASHRTGLTYAYTPDLDRIGHVFGVDSSEWRAAMREVDSLVDGLLETLTSRDVLVVTADHGMVDCAEQDRIQIDALPGAENFVIAGEPRMRHVYGPAERRDGLMRNWRQELGDRAWVLTREESIAIGLFGDVHPDYRERIGDVVAIARGTTSLVSQTDAVVSSLRGQHGSLTPEEMLIPLAVTRGQRA